MQPVNLSMFCSVFILIFYLTQGEHLSGKPGIVRDFGSCQENVRDFTKSQGNVRTVSLKNLVQKLFIVSCIFAFVRVFSSIQVVLARYECQLTWQECHES